MKWEEWIDQKFREWRGDNLGRGWDVTGYARWLGLDQRTVNSWMKENRKPRSTKSINALVAHYGREVYDVLGIDLPVGPIETDLIDLYILVVGSAVIQVDCRRA